MEGQQPQFNMSMLSGFLPLIIIFGLPRLGVDLNDPLTINVFRGITLVYILTVFVVYNVIIKGKITAQKKELEKEAVIFVDDKKEVQDVTAYEYDMSQIQKATKSLLVSSAISAGIHLYFKINQGIAIVPVTGLIALASAPLVKKYIRGEEVPRPYDEKKGGGLLASLSGTDPEAENKKLIDDYKKSKKISSDQKTTVTDKSKTKKIESKKAE